MNKKRGRPKKENKPTVEDQDTEFKKFEPGKPFMINRNRERNIKKHYGIEKK